MKKTSAYFPPARTRRRPRGLSVLSVTLATTSAVAARPAAATDVVVDQTPSKAAQDSGLIAFAIPAGPLDNVLAAFQRVTGIKVVLTDAKIGTLQSPGVTGSFRPARALDAILTGTGVVPTYSPNQVRLDVRGVSERVDVTGEARLSSPKATESLRDTPQTVAVIPQEVFMAQNATSLRDVLRNTPGITMSIGEGGSGGTSSGDNVMIRGFGARTDIYVDGVRDPGMVNRDAYNLESVEVAKGPASATGGRGTTGGSINLVSKLPRLRDSVSGRVTVGNASYGRTSVDVNRRLGDAVAFRVNGMWQDTGYAGRDVAKYRSWAVAPSLALGLGKPTEVIVSYSRMQQNNIPDWGIPTLLPDNAIAQGITVNDLDFSNFYGIASRDYEKTTSEMGTVTVNHSINAALTLRNLTRYSHNYRDAVLTPPRPVTLVAGQGSTDPGYDPAIPQIRRTDTKYQHRNDKLFTNQTDLTARFTTGAVQHSADVGFEAGRDRQPTYAFTDLFTFGRPPVDDLFHPTPFDTYTPALAKTGASTDAHATTTAAYAFDTLKLNDQWQIDLGLRWDHVKVDYTNVAANGVVTPFGRTDQALTGRNGVVYKPTANGSIYAAYSTSFSPSFDATLGLTLTATGATGQGLAPEKTHIIETGTKWGFARHIELTAAAFQMEKTNAKTTDENGATVLAGDQRVRGVEFGVNGNLTSRWSAFAGLSVMKGTVVKSGIATEVGQELAYVPHVTFNLWSTYQVSSKLTLGGSMNHNSGNFFNQTGGFLFVSGSTAQPKYVQNATAVQALTKYWVFNAMANYDVNNHVQLQINLMNIGNEKYADRAYDRHFMPGPTRQILISPVINW